MLAVELAPLHLGLDAKYITALSHKVLKIILVACTSLGDKSVGNVRTDYHLGQTIIFMYVCIRVLCVFSCVCVY